MKYCIEEHKIPVKKDSQKVKLLQKCRTAKHELTTALKTYIEVPGMEDEEIVLTKAKFEDLALPTLLRCMTPLNEIMVDSDLSRNQIDEIVLVGGSTRIPKLQELIC